MHSNFVYLTPLTMTVFSSSRGLSAYLFALGAACPVLRSLPIAVGVFSTVRTALGAVAAKAGARGGSMGVCAVVDGVRSERDVLGALIAPYFSIAPARRLRNDVVCSRVDEGGAFTE